MQNTPPNYQFQNSGNSRARLPFDNRKVDFVTWTYIHRAGIYMIVIVFLLFAIAFVSFKIQVGHNEREGASTVVLDFQEVATPEQERLAELQENQSYDYSSDYSNVANRQSNENAQLNSNIRDAQGSNASELYKQADKLSGQMAANRAEYEAGLRSEQSILSGRGGGSGSGAGSGSGSGGQTGRGTGAGSDSPRQDTRVKGGKVTVSFSFRDPIRNSVHLPVPAYLCEGGGEVVVNVALNKNGDVIVATVDRTRSSSDECMRIEAEKTARNSRFNIDNSAPAKHSGTITYIFIPQ